MNNEDYIRKCYELAVSAGKKGHESFGAVLVHNGEILEEAENTADFERKIFGHAEFNLVHKCANKYSDDVLAESVLYTSCAPCERCLGAIASLGVHRVVCGVSYKEFCRLLPFDHKELDREGLLKQLGIDMTITESVLEDEGMHVFEWWGGEYDPLEELIAEIGASALNHHCGLETPSSFRNSAAYLQNWLLVLKNDKRFIVSAAGKAEKAVQLILGEGQ